MRTKWYKARKAGIRHIGVLQNGSADGDNFIFPRPVTMTEFRKALRERARKNQGLLKLSGEEDHI